MKPGLLIVTLLSLISVASAQAAKPPAPSRPLEYRGLRLGMSADAAQGILREMDEKDNGQRRAKDFNDCVSAPAWNGQDDYCKQTAQQTAGIPDCSGFTCSTGGLTAYLNAGRVWGIQANLGGENVQSYVLAFTKKYGSPKVERRSYRNGLGNEFHGNVWTWNQNRASLEVKEICVGSLESEDLSDIPCLILYSSIYAPKEALPKI